MTFADELTFTEWHPLLLTCVPWVAVHERTGLLHLLRDERRISVAEPPGRWRARHRRSLHRLGFRRRSWRGVCLWQWTLPVADLDAAAQAHPLMNAAGPRTRVHERLARSCAREALVKEQVRRVLSDCFGLDPDQLCVELPEDDDEWDDAEDDGIAARVG